MKRFTLTPEHVALLRAANVQRDGSEFGAPCIDPKMPYGDSDVLTSMRNILGRENIECPHCAGLFGEDDEELTELHRETETALQVVLATGSFAPGEYEASDYGSDWKPSQPSSHAEEAWKIDSPVDPATLRR